MEAGRETLECWEERLPHVGWRAAISITIGATQAGGLSLMQLDFPSRALALGSAPEKAELYGCRVCIANHGFRAAHWKEDGHAFENLEEFNEHMKEVHGVAGD